MSPRAKFKLRQLQSMSRFLGKACKLFGGPDLDAGRDTPNPTTATNQDRANERLRTLRQAMWSVQKGGSYRREV